MTSPAVAVTAATMTEGQLLASVIEEAVLRRWMVYHARPAMTRQGYRTAMTGHPGFPDLVLARDGVVLFVELKAERGRVTPAQTDWLRAVGGVVWRPLDLHNGTVTEALR